MRILFAGTDANRHSQDKEGATGPAENDKLVAATVPARRRQGSHRAGQLTPLHLTLHAAVHISLYSLHCTPYTAIPVPKSVVIIRCNQSGVVPRAPVLHSFVFMQPACVHTTISIKYRLYTQTVHSINVALF